MIEQIEQEILQSIEQSDYTREALLLRPVDRQTRLFGIAGKIAEILNKYLGQIDADAAVAIAKNVFDQFKPQIPDMFEGILWVLIEAVVRRMFATSGTAETTVYN